MVPWHSCRNVDLLHDILEKYDAGEALVYWADASKSVEPNSGWDEVLGAGVAWRVKERGQWTWQVEHHELGQRTGSIADAELFALCASIGLAIEHINEAEKGTVKLLRIFSDAQRVLQDLGAVGKLKVLGPAISSPHCAVESLYDRADLFADDDIKLEIVCVKGHTGSRGNEVADNAAREAVHRQIVQMKKNGMKDCPKEVVSLYVTASLLLY
jgi:ribonuclease HI